MQKESWMLNPQCSELMSEWKVRSWLLNAQAANLPLKEGAEGMSVQSGHGQEAFWETLKKKKKKTPHSTESLSLQLISLERLKD